MSSSVDVHKRPKIWSYFSFGSQNPRRRTSVSLPTKASNLDDHEKPDRHSHSRTPSSTSLMGEFKAMNQGQRTRWLKAGGIILFIFVILFYLSPARKAVQGPFPGGDTASSPETATGTCTKSYDSSKPLIQYAAIIDAGSTGSRIHVYRFNNCGPTPELEEEKFKMTEVREGGSGLSSYKGDPQGAAESLDVLMKEALAYVPEQLQGCTPIAVKATAGLRKLGEEMSNQILAAVRNRLETVYPFPVVAASKDDPFRGGVEVMDGKDEGIYAWITINYLLGKIGSPEKTPSAAILDLGGGSTQIVFEPTFKKAADGGMPEKLKEGDHKYELTFGGRHFDLYQHSYLGYGLMEARNQLHAAVLNAYLKETNTGREWLDPPVPNPCLTPGSKKSVEIELGSSHPMGEKLKVTMVGPKTNGSAAQCRAIAESILNKDNECKLAPCAFNGVHQPSLAKTFAANDVFLVSYFYDRTNPLGMPSSFSLAELRDLTQRVCDGDAEGNWDVFKSIPGAMEELSGRPQHCLDLNFMLALLHTGYEMPIDREVRIAKKLKDFELGWCLGASLPLLSKESGWQCKVKEVTK